ncbi:phosphate ABC transporter substrate-binding protein [Sporotomaculum syntrophicum]|uniref:phosphate ABC transporter substrate-binding protein n=1 Tax=Sporotomaculum syntrophicum TaxID=182264 RepID=UPI001FAD8A0A|nr:phosphate ABC transporter substrate-binding protein [Sporotomaculum syntrophicum]
MKRRIWLSVLLCCILAFTMLAGCASNETGSENNAAPTEDYSIKIGGSSTLAPIIAQCADSFTEEFKTWDKVDTSLPEEPIVIFVSTGGSGFGLKSAVDGTFDFGMVSKNLKDEEKEQFANGSITQLGSDVLIIGVNSENPVAQVKPDLTTEELVSIFSGKIKNWQELDPALPDRSIVVAVRDLGGGASEVFDAAVMKGTPISDEALQIPSMGALAGKIMDNKDTIGYVSSGLVNQNPDKITPISVDGIAPTLENINSGAYKIGRALLLVSKDKPDNMEQKFLDYLLSEKGLGVVEELGYVPVAR